MPQRVLYGISGWLVGYYYKNSEKKIARIHHNIAIAFPSMGEEERRRFVDAYLAHHATTATEMLLLLTDRFELKRRIIDYDKAAQKLKSLAESAGERGAIFLTAHYGNWELLGAFTGEIGLPMSIVRKTMRNPLVYERIITPFRTRYGHHEYERKGALKGIVSGLRSGYPAGLLIDEYIPPPNGVLVDFFSKQAYTLKSVAQLKRKYNADIITVFIERREGGRFKIHIDESPFSAENYTDQEEEIRAITQYYTEKLERQIRKSPTQWQWMYDRWRGETQ
jgi:KDO2-lipid IV(A) lauroyltransferase